MEHVESLLSAVTFILKTLDHGQVDNMDIELLKSFSFSHLVIAESLTASANNVEDDNNDDEDDNNVEDDNMKDKCDNVDQENGDENIGLKNNISELIAVQNITKCVAEIEDLHLVESSINDEFDNSRINKLPQFEQYSSSNLESIYENEMDQHIVEPEEKKEEENQKKSLTEKVKRKKLLLPRCLFCDEDFKDQEEFNIHDSEKHFKDGRFQCVCHESFRDKKDALNHFMVFHNKKHIYPCGFCFKSFFSITYLRNHLKMTHDKLVPSQQCPICLDNITFTKKKLRNHIFKDHRSAKFICDICHKNICTKSALEKHIKQMHSSDKTKYTCEVCEKDYYSRLPFDNHVAKHNGEPTFQCLQCSKKCYTAFYLQRHEVYNHKNGEEKVFCTQCDYSTKKMSTLKRHMSGVHNDDRPFNCDSCDAKFKFKGAMSIHRKIHGTREHKCKYCDKLFVRSSQLKLHLDIHEDNYSFSCKICEKKFIQSGNLTLHMRKHHGTN